MYGQNHDKAEGPIENWGKWQQERQRVGLVSIHYTDSQTGKEISRQIAKDVNRVHRKRMDFFNVKLVKHQAGETLDC